MCTQVSRRRISAGTTTIDATGAAPPGSQGIDAGSGAVKQEDTEGVALDPLKLELDEDDLDRRAQDAQARDQQDRAALDAAEAEGTREGAEDGAASGSKADGASAGSASAASTTASASPMVLAKIKSKLLHAAVDRICAVGMSAAAAVQAGGGDKELWIQLISRLVTRGLPQPGQERDDGTDADGTPAPVPEEEEDEGIRKEKERIRKQIYDFVTADLGERIELARLWLNEEWYTESLTRRRRRRKSPADSATATEPADGDGAEVHSASAKDTPYARWLRQLLDYISSNAVIDKEKGTNFTQFVVDLPEIPKAELGRLARMCEEPTGWVLLGSSCARAHLSLTFFFSCPA